MRDAFSLDSKLYRAVDKTVSLVKLGLLWALFSIPVVTAGAAGCALYGTAVRIMADEEGYILQDFLKIFFGKWKQALRIWPVLLAAGIGLCLDLFFWLQQEGTIPEMMIGAIIMLILFWAMLVPYALALTVRLEAPARAILRSAALLAVKHLPKSLYMLLWTGIFLISGWLWTPVLFIELLAGAPLLAMIHGRVLEKILDGE